MKVELKFYSNWATGTGKTGGSTDSIVIKDKDGLPFIPGRTFKGLVRDAYRACGFKNEKVLFGQKLNIEITSEDLKKGAIRFNSVIVDDAVRSKILPYKQHLYTSKTSTALNDKQAVNHSLRKNEVVIPISLTTQITFNNDSNELKDINYKEEIELALKMLKRLGEKRHRGLGQCIASIVDTTNTNSTEDTGNEEVINPNTKTLQFKCTVNSPLILVKKAKTDQNIESLDYIPGNNFRGIVANKLFGSNADKEEINNIIFSKCVQFGDAHLAIDNERSYKVPYSFYYKKDSDAKDTMFNFHLEQELKTKTKQYRKGYLLDSKNNGKEIHIKNIEYGNRMKSSRNEKTRSSRENGLFVYHYIEKGQTFIFEITSNTTKHLEKVSTILNNQTYYFGKSKSAEFGGEVYIELLQQKPKGKSPQKGTYIYAESNLCFLNEYGDYTVTPTGEALTGSKEAVIDWTKSQIKYRTFTPYNGHRKNWDAERLIIEKGSVFVLKEDIEILKRHVGLYNNEGYGAIMVNPSFLTEEISISSIDESDTKETTIKKTETLSEEHKQLLTYLENKDQQHKATAAAFDFVKENKPKFSKATSTQWARVLNATKKAEETTALKKLLFTLSKDGKDKSICNGGSKKWDKKDTKLLKDFIDNSEDKKIPSLKTTRLLAKQMIHAQKK